jgi:hypothetical protein
MTSTDRRRLAAILGMLGSDHAGERAAAGLQAEAFRKKHGLTWEQMLATPPPEAVRPASEPPPPRASEPPAWHPPPPRPPEPPPRPVVASLDEWHAVFAPRAKDTKGHRMAVAWFGACALVLLAAWIGH